MLKPSVELREESGILVAEFWDCLRLDPAPVQDLRRKYEEHLKKGGHPFLVVDLNGVTFAGSAALGGFLAIQRLNRPYGGRLIFCNVDPNVFEVFRVSKLDSLFGFATDKAAAVHLASVEPRANTGDATKVVAKDGVTPATTPASPPLEPTKPLTKKK